MLPAPYLQEFSFALPLDERIVVIYSARKLLVIIISNNLLPLNETFADNDNLTQILNHFSHGQLFEGGGGPHKY